MFRGPYKLTGSHHTAGAALIYAMDCDLWYVCEENKNPNLKLLKCKSNIR